MESTGKHFFSSTHGVFQKTNAQRVESCNGFKVGMEIMYPRLGRSTSKDEMIKGKIRTIYLNIFGTESQEYFTLVEVYEGMYSTRRDMRDIAKI